VSAKRDETFRSSLLEALSSGNKKHVAGV